MSDAFHHLSDEALLAQCDVQVHRAGGPGGQHRNKVETAIRLVHGPTGLTAEGKDERSRTSNLRNAIARLREKLEKRAYRAPPRHKTKPGRGAVARRLDAKKHASRIKQARRGGRDE